MPDPAALSALALIVVLSNTVEAMTGFGATIIAVTLGALFLPIDLLVPILVPVNIVLSGWIAWRYRQHVARQHLLRRIIPAVGAGLPLGYLLFSLSPGASLKIVFGLFVVCYGFWQLRISFRPVAPRPSRRSPLALGWLVAGGVMQGLYASGGPMVVVYTSRVLPGKAEFRATLSALWLVMNMILASTHLFYGDAGIESYQASLFLLPPVALGIVLGEWLHHRVSELVFRRVTMVLLVLAGTALLSN